MLEKCTINEMVSKNKAKEWSINMTHRDIMQKHSVKDGVRHELTAEVKEPQIPVLAQTDSQ